MKILNSLTTGAFDLFYYPFRFIDPMWALLVVSALTGILMLWIFGKVSNQDAITVIRDRIRGNLIGIRLFGDDVGLMTRLLGRVLKDNAVYLRYALVPLIVTLVPVFLILAQIHLRMQYSPLDPGDRTEVVVEVAEGHSVMDGISLEVPAGVAIETPPVRAETIHEISWRVRADEPGRHRLVIHAGGETLEKELVVGGPWGPTSIMRSDSFVDQLLHPGETPIRGGGTVRRVEVTYPQLELSAFGFGVNWLIFFFIASIVFGFAFRKPLGVEI